MDRCIIFLSKYEDYLKSAKKIKDNSNLKVNINYVEDFILKENKIEILKNSIIYFLCNSELNKKLVELLRNTNCYIFNKKFFESNYTKLEMQELLINNNINTPQVYQISNKDQMKLPILFKENKHAGMIFEAYTKNTIEEFFKKFKEENFYVEEKINDGYEVKYYYVKGNIYAKGDSIIEKTVKLYCEKISNVLGLEVFSVDMIKKDRQYIVIDINPSAGFYLLDEARNKLINEIERI